MFRLHFILEDDGSMFFRNVVKPLPEYTVSHTPRSRSFLFIYLFIYPLLPSFRFSLFLYYLLSSYISPPSPFLTSTGRSAKYQTYRKLPFANNYSRDLVHCHSISVYSISSATLERQDSERRKAFRPHDLTRSSRSLLTNTASLTRATASSTKRIMIWEGSWSTAFASRN